MRIIILLSLIVLSGCSSTKFERGKFYITSDVAPTVTNDKNYRSSPGWSNKILIRGNKFSYIIDNTF